MSSMDKRAALVWLIAVASAIGLWVLMTGGPALAEKMLVEICVEEGSYLNLARRPRTGLRRGNGVGTGEPADRAGNAG